MDFCTLGMFIIDEIEYTLGQSKAQCVMGGAGTYAAIGARLVAGKAHADGVGWIVDMGSDFPADFRSRIESWKTGCVFRGDDDRLTTRAWNGYGPNEHRDFKYLTPKLRLDHNSISDEQVLSESFHLVCSPQRCIALVQGILQRRNDLMSEVAERNHIMDRPIFVWEPVPELCVPGERLHFQAAVRMVNIVSPNEEELLGFFASENDNHNLEDIAHEIVGWGIGAQADGAMVVRQGNNGCTAFTSRSRLQLRAYHLPCKREQSRVRDPTGGGNAFLGALAMAMVEKVKPSISAIEERLKSSMFFSPRSSSIKARRLLAALVCSIVAASYVIEQTGVPILSAEGLPEAWNGEAFETRLNKYLVREKDHLAQQMTDE